MELQLWLLPESCRQDAVRKNALPIHSPHRLSGTELKAQEVEADIRIVAIPVG